MISFKQWVEADPAVPARVPGNAPGERKNRLALDTVCRPDLATKLESRNGAWSKDLWGHGCALKGRGWPSLARNGLAGTKFGSERLQQQMRSLTGLFVRRSGQRRPSTWPSKVQRGKHMTRRAFSSSAMLRE